MATNIKKFSGSQSGISGDVTTTVYTTPTGKVAKVILQNLEIDSNYNNNTGGYLQIGLTTDGAKFYTDGNNSGIYGKVRAGNSFSNPYPWYYGVTSASTATASYPVSVSGLNSIVSSFYGEYAQPISFRQGGSSVEIYNILKGCYYLSAGQTIVVNNMHSAGQYGTVTYSFLIIEDNA